MMRIIIIHGQLLLIIIIIMLLVTGLQMGPIIRCNGKSEWKRIITVDQSQSRKKQQGNYVKIQDAIDAIPSNNVDPIFIRVEPGVYKEKIIVPKDKPFLTLSGRNASSTIITWNDGGDIFYSPTLTVFPSNFVGRYLTIQNTYGTKDKAVALRVRSEKAVFYACRIISYQDTLLDEIGRHFYHNCYIQGATDFIFGDASSLYKNCHLHSTSRDNGAITAQHRMSAKDNTGFYFVRCKVTGVQNCTLGRPWGPFSRVVFSQTFMSTAVLPQGWDDWGKPSTHRTAYYGEYKCFGPGSKRTRRVQWSRTLSNKEALPYMTMNMMDAKSWVMA